MKKYKFKATILKSDDYGHKKGTIIYPKGFYYQNKNKIILVGNVLTNDTVRLSFSVENVEIEIMEEK